MSSAGYGDTSGPTLGNGGQEGGGGEAMNISGMEPTQGVQGRDLRLWFTSDSPRPHLKPTASELMVMGTSWAQSGTSLLC